MKKILFTIIILICTNITYSQIPDALYKDSIGNFIKINGNKIEFSLSNIIGGGNIFIRKSTIVIYNDISYTGGSLSKYSYLNNEDNIKGKYIFNVKNINNSPLNLVSIYLYNCVFSFETYKETDSLGNAKMNITEMPKDSLIFIGENGDYYPLKIKLKNLDGGYFDIRLAKGDTQYAKMRKIKIHFKIIEGKMICNWVYKYPSGGNEKMHYELIKL